MFYQYNAKCNEKKNDFAEVLKNLALNVDLKIIFKIM